MYLIYLLFILIFLILVYKSCHQFRYYVKSLYYLTTYICIGLSWPYFIVQRTHPNNLRLIYRIQYNLSRILGLKVDIYNEDYLSNTKEPCVIISNHQSSLDMIVLSNLWPSNCTILAKRELKYVIPFGLFSYKSGIVYIDRSKTADSRRVIADVARRMNNEKLKVWIFPEGTRNPSFQLLPFKKGGFHLAIQAQVPICPVVISSYYPFYCKKEKRFERGRISMVCLPPILTVGKTIADIDELIEIVRDGMGKTFDEISQCQAKMEQ